MSEIRVDSLKAEDGISAPSFPNGIQVTGVVTATVLDATVPFLTVGSNAQFGNAGIVTATGLNINGNADVSGNLSVGGVLTYEDVKNVDSIGVVTARNGINVSGGNVTIANDIDVDGHTNLDNVSIAGVVTATTFVGALTGNVTGTASNASGATGDFSIADKIIHTGDTDTAIRFSAADTVSIETAGNEQVKFNHSTGTVLYNHIVPNNDSTKDIGTNSVRFRNIYADTIYGSGAQLTGIEGGKVRNYKHVVDAGYSASTWGSFTQIASFSYTPLQSDSYIYVIASPNFLWESSNVHNTRMKFGSNGYQQYNKTAKAASISGWLSGNPTIIFSLGQTGNTSSNAVLFEAQGTGSHTSYYNYSSAHSTFLLLEMAPEG